MPEISHDLEYWLEDWNFDACHFLSHYLHPVFSHHDPELPHLIWCHINFRDTLSCCFVDVYLQSEHPRAFFVIIHSLLMEISSFDWALRRILTFSSTKTTSICGVYKQNTRHKIIKLNSQQKRICYRPFQTVLFWPLSHFSLLTA